MSKPETTGKIGAGAGLFAAIASSLCCVGPLVAGIAGLTGAASTFSWIEPLRPYMIGFTVLALGFAFYQAYKPKKQEAVADCCAVEEKPKKTRFLQSKGFLWTITVISALLLTFPYYNGIFYAQNSGSEITANTSEGINQITYEVEGMTCDGCEHHIEGDLNEIEGIVFSDANYSQGTAIVRYDPEKVTEDKIKEVINGTGYTVTGKTNTNETASK